MGDQQDHTGSSRRRDRRRWLRAALAVFCVVAVGGAASLRGAASPSDPSPRPPLLRRSPQDAVDGARDDRRALSLALPHGGCQVTYAHLAPSPIPPVWQASFPGSGSRMTWSLVEALTGIRTNDDYDSHSRGYEQVVAVKTHYPVKDAKRRFKGLDKLFDRAIVILRNPINAIPSYFNLQYEHLNHLPNHSTRGPNEDWVKYRAHNGYGVAVQLQNYEKFVEYWMEKYPDRRQLLMVSYEDLTDTIVGPIVATRIAAFLGETEGVDPIVPESVPCVWETIVNYKNKAPSPPPANNARRRLQQEDLGSEAQGTDQDQQQQEEKELQEPELQQLSEERKQQPNLQQHQEAMQQEAMQLDMKRKEAQGEEGWESKLKQGRTHADPSSLRTGPKVRPYTEEMLMDMVRMFRRLAEKYGQDEDLVRILASYVETVSKTPIEEGL